MSSARHDILAAVTGALAARGTAPSAELAIAEAARRLLDGVPALRPDRVGADPVASFLARVTLPAIGASAERVATLAELPAAVRRYLAAHELAASVALQPHPDLGALDWQGVATHGEITLDEAVGVGIAAAGIAETGSLVFLSGPAAPTLFGFMPRHHIVALAASRILPWLEDCVTLLAEAHPRNLNLITGASGTTDIEGTLVRGAHGPGFLHVVLVDDRPAPITADLHP